MLRVIFVCHSMGGIVARRYLVHRELHKASPVRTSFGLFLVASPSLGSNWANWLQPIAESFGHSQADALRFSEKNSWLGALDREFMDLKESGKIELRGRELIEDKFIVLHRLLRSKLVERISGARYFGDQLKIAKSDHSSIAKPENAKAIQHTALCNFIKDLTPNFHPLMAGRMVTRSGRPEVLGRGVIKSLQQASPTSSMEQVDPDVQRTNLGVRVLIAKVDDPVIRETLGRFRDAFEHASRQILILKKYKGLHDSLHNLQATLEAVEDALARSKTDKAAARTLGKCAIDLKQIARQARAQIPDLPNSSVEQGWIEQLESCVSDMQRAAKPAAILADLDRLTEVPVQLRHLLSQAPRINQALIGCVASLPLGPLSETMSVIAEKIRPDAKSGDRALQQLDSGAVAVNELRYRLESLVSEHSEWQWLNYELDGAMLSSKHQPRARMPAWRQFEQRLTKLCDQNPNEDWANDLKQLLVQWIQATPSPQPDNAEKDAGEDAFRMFHHACFSRFFEVNTKLKALSEQIASVAGNLNVLLTAVK